MSLIKCPECGKMISDKAESCPHCGCPHSAFHALDETKPALTSDESTERQKPPIKLNTSDEKRGRTILITVIAILIGIGLITLLAQGGCSQQNNYNSLDSTFVDSIMTDSSASDVTSNLPANDKNTSEWSYDQDKDELTGKSTWFASVTSENYESFDFPYNDTPIFMTIAIRKSPRYGTDVYISVPTGQFNTGIDETYISVRFDEGKVTRWSCNEPSDNSSTVLFINNAKAFINKLKSSKECRISAEFYQQGSPTFTFKTAGLKWNH